MCLQMGFKKRTCVISAEKYQDSAMRKKNLQTEPFCRERTIERSIFLPLKIGYSLLRGHVERRMRGGERRHHHHRLTASTNRFFLGELLHLERKNIFMILIHAAAHVCAYSYTFVLHKRVALHAEQVPGKHSGRRRKIQYVKR